MENTIDCCACGLCEVVCPKNCIERIPAERKSVNLIKGKNCIQCGKCDCFCPIKRDDLFHSRPEQFFKAISKRSETLYKSASGGIAHELAVAVIEAGGFVYGAAWDAECQCVKHMKAQKTEELARFQGSKYVQSIITADTYLSIKNDLKENIVLFIGTPCEVAAVRSFTNDSDRLLCVDLVCHGVPSPAMLEEQIKQITDQPVKSISFRDRLTFRLRIDDGQSVYESPWEDNPYYSLFMHFASLREYCYRCKFACNTRVGDITVGDYAEGGKGYSCVVVNSDKGKDWFCRISEKLESEEKPMELLRDNHAFNQPTTKHPNTDRFSEKYKNKGLEKAYRKVFFMFRMKRKARKMLGDDIYQKIKKLFKK